MLRIASTQGGEAEIDRLQVLPGRGAYLCYSRECAGRGRKKLAHALRTRGGPAEGLFDEIDREIGSRDNFGKDESS
ncbi:MAG: hypothetical protein DCC49_08030 [Acidobacteria bacterium]|nr:MAG: hypothetical protein DCC49_08030 [Acidobacteriota bacterium]